MKSGLAEQSRQALASAVARMTAAERLAAFLAHCELMAALRAAGRRQQPRLRHAD